MSIAVDFETYYDTKLDYGIRELGAYGYCHHPLFNPYLISVSDGVDSWAGSPKDFNWDSLTGQTLLSHNEYFDGLVYSTMVERDLAPPIEFKEWLCTANMTSYLCNRRSLADSVEFLLGVRLEKTVRNEADGKTEAVLRSNEAGWKSMLDYGRSDALRCWQLFDKYGHLWPQHERDLSRLTIEQGRRGVQIDTERLNRYIAAAQGMLLQAESTLPWIAEGRKPTSPKAIAELCRKEGIPCPPIKSREGEEAFLEWEAAYSPKYVWIASVANWRSINKFLETLLTIKQRLVGVGILPFALKYFGAHTGRWSGDAGINFQNFRKEPIYRDSHGFMVSDPAKLKEIEQSQRLTGAPPQFVTAALDIRALIIPRPGTRMIISDLAQIEPRGLAWIVGDQAMLDMVGCGQSPYEAHARLTMGFTGASMKKEDKDGYALAKARVLGLGYGCGWEKFIAVAAVMAGLDITKEDPELVPVFTEEGDPALDAEGKPKFKSGYGTTSRKIVQNFRDSNPKITALWKRLDNEFRSSEGGNFEMTLPSGRVMRYGQVRREWRVTVDPETGKSGRKLVFTAMVGDHRTIVYGGLLTENLVQATARDIFGYGLLQLEKTPGVKVLFTSHDEAVIEVLGEITPGEVEKIMCQNPPWCAGLPIGAEAIETAHYKK